MLAKRKLGNTRVRRSSAIGLGCMGMSFAYGETGQKRNPSPHFTRAIELGCTFARHRRSLRPEREWRNC